jgi:hypothetical protein
VSVFTVFFMDCLLLCFGFHPRVLSLVMSRSMFLTSPFQPIPPSTPPVSLSLTFLSFISFTTVSAMVLTLVWSSEPMLYISTWFFVFSKPKSMASMQSFMCRYDLFLVAFNVEVEGFRLVVES